MLIQKPCVRKQLIQPVPVAVQSLHISAIRLLEPLEVHALALVPCPKRFVCLLLLAPLRFLSFLLLRCRLLLEENSILTLLLLRIQIICLLAFATLRIGVKRSLLGLAVSLTLTLTKS